MKKLIALTLIALTLTTLFACGKSQLKGTVDELFADIQPKMYGEEIYNYTTERLEDDLLIKEEYFTDGYFKYSVDEGSVESVAFFVATSAENATLIYDALTIFVDDTKREQENYNEDNFEMAKNAIVKKDGLYVYLIMSPNQADVDAVIKEHLK